MADPEFEAEKAMEMSAIVRGLQAHALWLAENGVLDLPTLAAANAAPLAAPTPRAKVPNAQSPVVSVPAAAATTRPLATAAAANPVLASAVERQSLPQIRETLGECTRCRLHQTRKNIVFGVGNPHAELCFVGEGPGADEDARGEPFVGRAGQLLDKMIEAMGFARTDVYICNVVKCRPPENRAPEPDEMNECLPFLQAQLRSVAPKAIVVLGKTAAQALLNDKTPISRLRGRWHEYGGVPLMPTFHPAYLLRSPGEKAKAWEDLKAVVKHLGRELPTAKK